MVIREIQQRWTSLMATALILMMGLSACSSGNDEPEPDLKPGDTVTDFKQVKQYSATAQFQNDLDALVTYAFDIRAVKWTYYLMASNGKNGEPFSVKPEDIEKTKDSKAYAEGLYDIIDDIVERSEQYEEALQRLEDSDVLTRPTSQTRGILSDAIDFMFSCKKTQTMGRKSVVTVMRELGWTNDAKKLKEVYDGLPSNLKRGYSNSNDFWRDFSKGNLDSRANQVFVNMYNYADPSFGDKARDLDITPGKNITVAGAELIEKGSALVIDASPMSAQLGYGKDLYNSVKATEDLFKKGDVKGFMQNVTGNLINYGRDAAKLAHKMQGLDIIYWDAADNFWDNFGKDAATIYANDIAFESYLKEDTGELIPNMVRTRDKNGQEINLLVMVDTQSGKTIIGYVFDKDGNIITNPELPGNKQITVVNRNTGKRTTKTVPVPKDGETVVETEFDEVKLDENPENGYIEVKSNPFTIGSAGGNFKAMIVSNYLYYTCATKDDWLSASIANDINYLYFRASTNDTGQERRGSITVSATDSKGKVLKSTVLTVVQQIPEKTEYWVSASPSTVEFDAKGGQKEVVIDHSYALNYTVPVIGDDLAGWCDLTWKETATGWNIVVDVTPNDTGQERSGSFTIYAAASEEYRDRAIKEGVFDPDVVQATTVIVKQAAKNTESFSPDTEIDEVSFSYYCYYTGTENGKSWEDYRNDVVVFKAENLSVSKSGNSLSVSGTLKKPYSTAGVKGQYDYNISFDASYNSEGFTNIKNIKVTRNQEITEGVAKGSTSSYVITAAEMPLTNQSTSRASWGGIESKTGQIIKSWEYQSHAYFDGKDQGTSSYSYEKNDKNSIHVFIDWKRDE